MVEINEVFDTVVAVVAAPWTGFGDDGPMDADPFVHPIDNFYMTDPISRSSETMALCTQAYVSKPREATGTDG